MITQEYNLNLIPSGVPLVVHASQYDTGSRTILFNIYNGTELFDIDDYEDDNSTTCTVYVMGTKTDSTGYQYECTFSGSQVSFEIQTQMTVLSGKHSAEIRIVDTDDNIIGTANFTFDIEKAGLSDDTVVSETDLSELEEFLENWSSIQDDLEWLEEQVNKVYGIKRLISSSSTSWDRTNDAVGLTASATHDGDYVSNDFDNLYPWKDIKTVNLADDGTVNAQIGDADFAWDGSNGEVMTYIPPFYWQRVQEDGYEYIRISNNYFVGSSHSSAFYVGRYTTSSGTHSISGVTSSVSTTITAFRTNAQSKGDGWQQLDYHIFLIWMLYLVEYADYNIQSVLGNGVMSESAQVASGDCDSLEMYSGCLSNDNVSSVIYRGIENLYGNIWQFVDGLNITDYVGYICYEPGSYAVDTFSGDYSALGYTNASANGWVTTLGYDSDNPMVMLPTAVGGSSSTYIPDYYYQNSGNRIALFGGAWSAGLGDGFYWGLSFDSSGTYASIGSRLLYK